MIGGVGWLVRTRTDAVADDPGDVGPSAVKWVLRRRPATAQSPPTWSLLPGYDTAGDGPVAAHMALGSPNWSWCRVVRKGAMSASGRDLASDGPGFARSDSATTSADGRSRLASAVDGASHQTPLVQQGARVVFVGGIPRRDVACCSAVP